MNEELCFDIGFALRWIAPETPVGYFCAQLDEPCEVTLHFSPLQLEALSLGQQIAFLFSCVCGYTHWPEALYVPMYLKMNNPHEVMSVEEILRRGAWRQ